MNISAKLLIALVLCLPSMVSGQSSLKRTDEIASVDFCEMVRHPEAYFDRTIRLIVTVEPRIEGTTLNDVRCVRSHDDQIGLGTVEVEKQAPSFAKGFEKIRSGKAGQQPRVTAIGILRNQSRRDFEWYRYRFDIIAFEEIHQDAAETILTYGGMLRAGMTYRATVQYDKDFGLSFETPIRIPLHQAVRLEWTNLKTFPALEQLRGRSERQIVFRVVSDDIQQMTAQRWNRTLRLEILLDE